MCHFSVAEDRRRTFELNVDLSATVVIAAEVKPDSSSTIVCDLFSTELQQLQLLFPSSRNCSKT